MLVVVIGGIGLAGGKGGMRNVIVGALLIGIMLNAMTIIDIPQHLPEPDQVDDPARSPSSSTASLNPRDEQTAQQGDI